jgi:energy-coupling factor transporter ATP-binding protein EcfA2
MDPTLHQLIVDRLIDEAIPDGVAGAVLGACRGAADLDDALHGVAVGTPAPRANAKPEVTPAAAYLASITVEGFRGVGPSATLRLPPGPALTLVMGRNGSGKSTFAEAVEYALSGDSPRWHDRPKVWSGGWRNLHHAIASVTVELLVDGRPRPLMVERSWAPGSDLGGAQLLVDGRPADAELGELHWGQSLHTYRPFLSHSELGSLLDEGPTKLHDALAAILGLDDLTAAQRCLADARLSREKALTQVKDLLSQLLGVLRGVDDERARASVRALEGSSWDLDAVELALAGETGGPDAEGPLQLLRALATLAVPSQAVVAEHCSALVDAADRVDQVGRTDAGRAQATAALLRQALELHRHTGNDDCPVCGTAGVLTPQWGEATAGEVERLETMAKEAQEAHRAAVTTLAAARSLIGREPLVLARSAEVGVDPALLRDAWAAWSATPEGDDQRALAAHLTARCGPLAAAAAALSEQAGVELTRREDAWRPVAHRLASWLVAARPAASEVSTIRTLKSAEAWLKGASAALRAERFAPIADQVERTWSLLRQSSNVSLDHLRLDGSGPARRVVLDVTVDGEAGAALGVMSQGELNCLALSLFLPRAGAPQSPFRFVVIDDPVQAMDPSKVEGLARVLADVATGRQVVVFSHDERLPEAVRRLDIPATIVEVTRREGSVVELRTSLDPVRRAIDDAFAIANSKKLPPHAARIVPGFCRTAIEAACAAAVTRRHLAAGESHAVLNELLDRPTTVNMWAALALFDDPERGNEVMATLNRRFGIGAGDVFARCRAGSHAADTGDLRALVRGAERVAQQLAQCS